MPDDGTPLESNRATAEKSREDAEDLREEADRGRDTAEEHRVLVAPPGDAAGTVRRGCAFKLSFSPGRALHEQVSEAFMNKFLSEARGSPERCVARLTRNLVLGVV